MTRTTHQDPLQNGCKWVYAQEGVSPIVPTMGDSMHREKSSLKRINCLHLEVLYVQKTCNGQGGSGGNGRKWAEVAEMGGNGQKQRAETAEMGGKAETMN